MWRRIRLQTKKNNEPRHRKDLEESMNENLTKNKNHKNNSLHYGKADQDLPRKKYLTKPFRYCRSNTAQKKMIVSALELHLSGRYPKKASRKKKMGNFNLVYYRVFCEPHKLMLLQLNHCIGGYRVHGRGCQDRSDYHYCHYYQRHSKQFIFSLHILITTPRARARIEPSAR